MVHTEVNFQTSDSALHKLFHVAEEKARWNIKDFAGRTVLIEGGGYEKIWLETQPMGGEMYAKRNMAAGVNNNLLFMECQRADGRIPGSIAMIDGVLTPQFNKFQGFCFPEPAMNLYYLMGEDTYFLELLYSVLERFDAYLWRVRDSDGDGCLESWCKYDTGEDNALRYGDAPDAWEAEVPPQGFAVVPMASIDVMSYSYSCRKTLAEISGIFRKEAREQYWKKQAEEIRYKIRNYLWSEERGACLDRDKNHRVLPTLMHNTLRAMYWGSVSREMADRFVKEHLLNPQEFWTKLPLPSVAVNDPLFRNVTTNNWSGQAEALTYQRAIRALENYGYDALIPVLGEKLFGAIGEEGIFVQQYDPFTGEPSKICHTTEQDAYGPAILSVLEYTARMHGVHREKKQIFWGTCGKPGQDYEYEQIIGDNSYLVKNNNRFAEGFLNGKLVWKAEADQKIITDLKGNVQTVKPFV